MNVCEILRWNRHEWFFKRHCKVNFIKVRNYIIYLYGRREKKYVIFGKKWIQNIKGSFYIFSHMNTTSKVDYSYLLSLSYSIKLLSKLNRRGAQIVKRKVFLSDVKFSKCFDGVVKNWKCERSIASSIDYRLKSSLSQSDLLIVFNGGKMYRNALTF